MRCGCGNWQSVRADCDVEVMLAVCVRADCDVLCDTGSVCVCTDCDVEVILSVYVHADCVMWR